MDTRGRSLPISDQTHFIKHCLKGLNSMYIPSEHVFSASYRMIGKTMSNLRDHDKEYKYSMNCLMGLFRVRASGSPIFLDIESDYYRLVEKLDSQLSSPENIAATMWTGMCLGIEVPAKVRSQFERVQESASESGRLTAQGLAWGIAACLEAGEELRDMAHAMISLAQKQYVHPESFLVRHLPTGFRKDFASFAASCYMAYAFLLFARKTGSQEAKEIGLRISRSLVCLQGPQGQWAWFYHVPSGKVIDYYPVYSVHQHAMAPFFLLEAIDQGYAEFREPLEKGFCWIFGNNELQKSMVAQEHRIIWRSAVRREAFSTAARFTRSFGIVRAGKKASIQEREKLLVNNECRSYELGWALWSFAGRHDFDKILNNSVFI
jgi:hypothetical protein